MYDFNLSSLIISYICTQVSTSKVQKLFWVVCTQKTTWIYAEFGLNLRRINLVFCQIICTFSLCEKFLDEPSEQVQVLSLDNENKWWFILHFARLFVTLQQPEPTVTEADQVHNRYIEKLMKRQDPIFADPV